jgi:hypothetical protein
MKKLLGALLVLSLALNIFLWSKISNQAGQLKSAQATANDTEELRRQVKELQIQQASAPDSAEANARELARLRNQVGQLRKQAGDAESLRAQAAEAAQLRAQLADTTKSLATKENALAAVKSAKQKEEESTACVNNMKQIGLAARMWAGDHNAGFPLDFITMKDFLRSPTILVCPSDTTTVRVKDWEQFNPTSVGYRYLNPGGNESQPEKVLAVCPIHGHVLLSDGSVQRKQ